MDPDVTGILLFAWVTTWQDMWSVLTRAQHSQIKTAVANADDAQPTWHLDTTTCSCKFTRDTYVAAAQQKYNNHTLVKSHDSYRGFRQYDFSDRAICVLHSVKIAVCVFCICRSSAFASTVWISKWSFSGQLADLLAVLRKRLKLNFKMHNNTIHSTGSKLRLTSSFFFWVKPAHSIWKILKSCYTTCGMRCEIKTTTIEIT